MGRLTTKGPFDKPRSLYLLMRSNIFVPHLTAVSWPPQAGLLLGHRISLAVENFKTGFSRATTRAMTPPTAVLVIAFWSYVVMPIRLGKFFVGGAGPIISWHELARPEHVRALWLERLATRPGGSHLVAHPRTHVLFMHGSHLCFLPLLFQRLVQLVSSFSDVCNLQLGYRIDMLLNAPT